MEAYLGDYATSATIDFTFSTVDPVTRAPAALSAGALAVYKTNSTTESSAGVTLTAGFDGVTGLNHVRITLATDTGFYSAAADFNIVFTAGTVGGLSVVGRALRTFSVANRRYNALAATDIVSSGAITTSGGAVTTVTTLTNGVNVMQISGDSTAADNLERWFDGTVGFSTSEAKLRLNTTGTDPAFWATSSGGPAGRFESSYANSTGTGLELIAADSGSYCLTMNNTGGGGGLQASISSLGGLVTNITGNLSGAAGSVTGAVGSVTGSVGSVATNGITAASIATGAIDADALATDAVTEIAGGITIPAAGAIADAVWDELLSGHTTAGSAGKALTDAEAGATPVEITVNGDSINVSDE